MALSDAELQLTAQALRAFAVRTNQEAERIENPSLRDPLINAAKQAAELAERIERTRKARAGTKR